MHVHATTPSFEVELLVLLIQLPIAMSASLLPPLQQHVLNIMASSIIVDLTKDFETTITLLVAIDVLQLSSSEPSSTFQK